MKTREEIIQRAINKLASNTQLRNFSSGSVVRQFIEIIGDEFADIYSDLADILYNIDLSKATGTYLDVLGSLFGIERRAAKRAADLSYTNFKFYIDPSTGYTTTDLLNLIPDTIESPYILKPNSFIIPAGIKIYNDNRNITYVTLESAVFINDSAEVYVPIEAEHEGGEYNVHAGELIEHNLSLTYPEFYIIAPFIKCINTKSIMSGASVENDENYRYRIANARLRFQSANETAIRLAALSVPGVADVIMRPKFYSFDVIVIPENYMVNEGLLRAVQFAVNNEAAYPIKGNVLPLVYRAVKAHIKLGFKGQITKNEYEHVIKNVATQIATHINRLYPGNILYLSDLKRIIYSTSPQINKVSLELRVGFYDYINNEIYDEYIVTNDIKSEWNEKFYTNLDYITVC